jgi:hypothetical protein
MEKRFKELIGCENLGTSKFEGDACNDLDFEDLKEIYTMKSAVSAGGSDVLKNALGNQSERIEETAQMYVDWDNAKKASELEAKNSGWPNLRRTNSFAADLTPAYIEKTSGKNEIPAGEVMRYFIPPSYAYGNEIKTAPDGYLREGKDIIIHLKKQENSNIYTADGFYSLDGVQNFSCEEGKEECAYIREFLTLEKAQQFIKADPKAYENRIKKPDELIVKYFDRAPYKGLPAEVPFDVDNGWYVEMEYVLSGFGKPYDESGRVVNFYICNAGENGRIEFKRKADDICRYYNGVSDELGFPGMSGSESRTLVSRAKNAVSEAMKYYGKEEAYIGGRKFSTGISFGGEGGICTDFMSPSDCSILFNVCDPVICPASRCDLGGNFPVDNVIQTGIIGSLVLCLPNMQEGIYVPICLSGVHAGIEGYLSILKAHRDCLNESLATGRTIGICDEIRSIYLCEFFWRQMVPFMDVLLPKLVESFFSQGVRGGGEYLTVQSAWDNTQKSIDYFTNEYAVNSMKAFQIRSTEEAGSEICKNFISARYPTDLDILTEPDSPPQYHAWFDENVMTTATPYPTSHYKVYYHIYSGNDQGAYYTVYLKDIPEEFTSSYIYQSDYYVVDRGYVAVGGTVDEARDFTAPSGYKQLCININGQDECGFGKVSTSFAVNYVTDLYVKEQAGQEIDSSEDCVSGTPSVYSLAQPNLQAGAEEVINQELYNQGIVRVCSTYNPGRQLNAKGEYDTTNSTYDRWKDVGHCGDKTIRCWLDTESVKDVIKNKELETQALKEVDTSVIGSGDFLTSAKSREIAGNGEKLIEEAVSKVNEGASESEIEAAIKTTEEQFEELSVLSSGNSFRAKGLLLLGELYEGVANKLRGFEATNQGDKGNPEGEQGVQTARQKGLVENKNTDEDYFAPHVESEASEEDSEEEEEKEEEIEEESIRVSVKYGWFGVLDKNPEIDVESYRVIRKVKFVKNKQSDEVYVSTDLNSEKFEGEWKIATSGQKSFYENQ